MRLSDPHYLLANSGQNKRQRLISDFIRWGKVSLKVKHHFLSFFLHDEEVELYDNVKFEVETNGSKFSGFGKIEDLWQEIDPENELIYMRVRLRLYVNWETDSFKPLDKEVALAIGSGSESDQYLECVKKKVSLYCVNCHPHNRQPPAMFMKNPETYFFSKYYNFDTNEAVDNFDSLLRVLPPHAVFNKEEWPSDDRADSLSKADAEVEANDNPADRDHSQEICEESPISDSPLLVTREIPPQQASHSLVDKVADKSQEPSRKERGIFEDYLLAAGSTTSEWRSEVALSERNNNILFVQNLDPSYSSSEVKEAMDEIFPGKIKYVKVIPEKNISYDGLKLPGKAVVVAMDILSACEIVEKMDKEILFFGNRPVCIKPFSKEDSDWSEYDGHISLRHLNLMSTEPFNVSRMDLPASHPAQVGTAEMDYAMDMKVENEIHKQEMIVLLHMQRKERGRDSSY